MTAEKLAKLIKQKYGAVKRARGAFLYTASGTRLLDMYLESGRAILGWKAGSSLTVFKNVLNRGAIGSYDTGDWEALERAVRELFGKDRKVKAFTDKAAAFRNACALSENSTMFWRPWLVSAPPSAACIEPWLGEAEEVKSAECIIFQPPFPWGEPLYLLAAKSNLAGVDDAKGCRLPSALCAAISRSVYDLKAELPLRTEKDWFLHDKLLSRCWTRRGPYLYPKTDEAKEEAYDAFVEKCLECAIVISPDCNIPSIVSPGLNAGVFKKLCAIAK